MVMLTTLRPVIRGGDGRILARQSAERWKYAPEEERPMAEGSGLDAPITAVTVFRDGARVQRSGTVNVERGLRPVVIGNLPASADPASVRVAARGPDLALLNVEAQRELEAAEQRLGAAEKRVGRSVVFAEVSATLEASAATRAEVELSYHVSGASWRPLYDLALEGERLAVSYLAEVTQQTGEDWPAVELVLSTTRRALHQTLPELHPWYIGRAQPVPRSPAGTSMALAGAVPQRGAHAAMFAASAGHGGPETDLAEATPLAAEPGEAGAGVAYRVQRPLAVPADGGPHKTMVARFALDATVDHLAVPVLAPEAYLRATVTNTSSLLLLPGPARVFHDAQYVGETSLETVAAGEEFELQLGVDDQVRVDRELRRRSP